MTDEARKVRNEYFRQYREKNREKLNAYNRKYYSEHKEQRKASFNKYWENKAKEIENAFKYKLQQQLNGVIPLDNKKRYKLFK